MFLFWFVVWFLLCFAIGSIASRLNRSAVIWFFVSFFLSPVIAGLFLLIAGKAENKKEVELNDDIYDMKASEFVSKYKANESQYDQNEKLKNMFDDINNNKKIEIALIDGALSFM